ncbi:unnamed protein product, partial [Hymenolepis diminuta]
YAVCLTLSIRKRNLIVGYGTLQRRADYNSLATQLSNYADMKDRISSIVRNTFTQIEFSASTKDLKDYVENVKLLQQSILNTMIFIRRALQVSPTPLELPCCFVNLKKPPLPVFVLLSIDES